MRASIQEQKGSAGVNEVAAKFERIGWGPAQNPHHDLGTDLYLALRDERLVDLGMLAGAQVKAGRAKYFREPKKNAAGDVVGWWYRESKRDHFDYWINHHAPHFLVLHDLETNTSYWVLLSRETVTFLNKGAKVLVPAHQTLDSENAGKLLAAASSSTQETWEGSSWGGATNLSPTHIYRHALLTPRLVAPHPNLSVKKVSAAQALALVVLGRSWRYDSRRDRGDIPPLTGIDASWSWDWQLVAGLHEFITKTHLDGLSAALQSAIEPHQQAASAVVLAAAHIEDGRPDRAAETTRQVLDQDHLETIDHAWVGLQHARALFETGEHDEARETSFELVNLRNQVPKDVTAAAISAAAANLLFAVADWDDLDFGKTIAVGDTTAAWWRQQVTAQGLGLQTDELFKAWAQQTTSGYGTDEAWEHLRAAGLMAGFAGDHRGWCASLGRLARHVLTDSKLSSDPQQVRSGLRTMRLAGAHDDLASAAKWLIDSGSAGVVKEVADECRPEQTTTTTLHPEIALLTAAGDLLDTSRAQSLTSWSIGTFERPEKLTRTLRPHFDVQSSLLAMLAALTNALPKDEQSTLLGWALSAELDTPGLSARPMRDLLLAMPAEAWTMEFAQNAARRAEDAPDRLKYALQRAAAPHLPEVKRLLVADALDGSQDALWALGNVTTFDTSLVDALIERSVAGIESAISGPRASRGVHNTEDAEALALMNICHPQQARWDPLYDLLGVVEKHSNLYELLDRLAHAAERLPHDVMAKLEPLTQRLIQLGPSEDGVFMRPRDFAPAARHLAAAIDCRLHGNTGKLLDLLGGAVADRQSAALLCHEADALKDGVLATLGRDRSPYLRATVASVLTHRASAGDVDALTQLSFMVDDPSVSVARAIASSAADHPRDDTWRAVSKLADHPSGRVRASIDRMGRALANPAV